MTPEYFELYSKVCNQESFLFPPNVFFHDVQDFAIEEESNSKIPNLNSFYNGIRRAINLIEKDTPSPKIPWIVEKIKEHVKDRKKLLIYSNWRYSGIDILTNICEREDIPFAQINGETSSTIRLKAVEDYNSAKICVLFITSAGSEGLDLKETKSVIITETYWNNERLRQVVGRAVRYKSHINLPKERQFVNIWKYHSIFEVDYPLISTPIGAE